MAHIDPAISLPVAVADTDWMKLWQETNRFKFVIECLAEEDAEFPDVGIEVGHEQIPVDYAWTSQQVLLAETLEPEDAQSLEDQGWIVLLLDGENGDDAFTDYFVALHRSKVCTNFLPSNHKCKRGC